MKILHIAAHLGAGAGKAVSGIAISDKSNKHKIILLDRPEKYDHIKKCEQNGIEVKICPTAEEERDEVLKADVVVVNWWHHPLTYRMLANIEKVPSRLILWAHINGLNYPELKPDFISCFDACIFTSSASYENKGWKEQEKKTICENVPVVYGMGDFQPEGFSPKEKYEVNQKKIRIGYVGSLDYAKLHPDFVQWLKAAVEENRNIYFELAGDVTRSLEHDVIESGIAEHVRFLGFREDIRDILAGWDAFVYLLNPYNFATTENALLEAKACGLPIVASDGIVERTIIQDGEDGILVRDKSSFVTELNRLLKSYELRKVLGEKAREDVIEKYDIERNILRFDRIVDGVARNDRKKHEFSEIAGNEPFEWFLSGCSPEDVNKIEHLSEIEQAGMDDEEVRQEVLSLKDIFKGNAKASVSQYHEYFPEDRRLDNLNSIIEKTRRCTYESKDRNKILY